MSSPPGPNQWTATPRRTCAAHAGTPGCPTTRLHNGSVGRAAIALWIVSASARFVQAARSGDPGAHVRARSTQPNVRSVACVLPGSPARSMLVLDSAHSHEVWIKGRSRGVWFPRSAPLTVAPRPYAHLVLGEPPVTAEVPVGGRPRCHRRLGGRHPLERRCVDDVRVVDGEGLTAGRAATRLASSGPNAVVSHRCGAWSGQLHQLALPAVWGCSWWPRSPTTHVGEQSDAGDHRGDAGCRLGSASSTSSAREGRRGPPFGHPPSRRRRDPARQGLDVLADGVTEAGASRQYAQVRS
jgi:hypothetical protein